MQIATLQLLFCVCQHNVTPGKFKDTHVYIEPTAHYTDKQTYFVC